MNWQSILKKPRVMGLRISYHNNPYYLTPDQVEEYKQEIANLQSDPYMNKLSPEKRKSVALMRIIKKYNLKPTR